MGAASSVLPESLTTVECQELASAHFAPALSRSPWLSAALAKRGRVRKRDALAAWKRYKESVVLREVAAATAAMLPDEDAYFDKHLPRALRAACARLPTMRATVLSTSVKTL